ncbi:hypothetical protein [Paenimyroides ceti]|uniref:hypothetical protein n=1 Tax=Paenimyroides ceti TaxID=395087 RepID=UPI0029500144|nr:hypothetical protein [Paenimyroides ceti]
MFFVGSDPEVHRYWSKTKGEGNIKYTYNNGIIAKDEKLASMNSSMHWKSYLSILSRSKRKLLKYKKMYLFFRKC